jgi:hypothetical protein
LLYPQAQNLFLAISARAKGNMDRLVADNAFVADIHPQRVKEHQRIGRIKRPLLPCRHLVKHRIGHRADQVGRHLHALELAQTPANLARAHASGMHGDDLVIKAGKTPLIFADQLRIKARLAVARHLDAQPARIRQHRLFAIAVAAVAKRPIARKMMIHLRVQRLLQTVGQSAMIKSRAGVTARQKLIQKLIRYYRFFAS